MSTEFHPDPKPEPREKKPRKSLRDSYREKQREKGIRYSYAEAQAKKLTKEGKLKLKQQLQAEIDKVMGREPKEKKKSISRLKKIADKLFSEVIRRTYADGRGRVKCITCDTKRHWRKMQNGHYITRAAVRVRYSIYNAHPQCPGCNLFKKGAPDIYALKLIEMYGKNVLNILNELKTDTGEWGRAEYMEVIEENKQKLIELNKK